MWSCDNEAPGNQLLDVLLHGNFKEGEIVPKWFRAKTCLSLCSFGRLFWSSVAFFWAALLAFKNCICTLRVCEGHSALEILIWAFKIPPPKDGSVRQTYSKVGQKNVIYSSADLPSTSYSPSSVRKHSWPFKGLAIEIPFNISGIQQQQHHRTNSADYQLKETLLW